MLVLSFDVAEGERRSPHGECGLKYVYFWMAGFAAASLPAWGVWIEMVLPVLRCRPAPCRSPHGECGLKFVAVCVLHVKPEVAPRMGSVD